MPDDIQGVAKKLKGKKAKVKKLDAEPKDTKARKLPKDVKEGLEEALGAKLKDVRIHTGGNAAELCKQLKAKAFAIGTDLYLSKGSMAADKHLLAHELTHVVQQGGGRIKKGEKGKALVSK